MKPRYFMITLWIAAEHAVDMYTTLTVKCKGGTVPDFGVLANIAKTQFDSVIHVAVTFMYEFKDEAEMNHFQADHNTDLGNDPNELDSFL